MSDPIRARMDGYAKDLKLQGQEWHEATDTNQFLRARGLTWQDQLSTAKRYMSALEELGMADPRLYVVYAWCARFCYERGEYHGAFHYASNALSVVAHFSRVQIRKG